MATTYAPAIHQLFCFEISSFCLIQRKLGTKNPRINPRVLFWKIMEKCLVTFRIKFSLVKCHRISESKNEIKKQ
jgi:hypothetical protein